MIEIEGLSCGYGQEDVLKGIELHLRAGELVGMLGPNGSGKSTLMLALAGVLPYHSGNIRVAGREVAQANARWCARKMASVQLNNGSVNCHLSPRISPKATAAVTRNTMAGIIGSVV